MHQIYIVIHQNIPLPTIFAYSTMTTVQDSVYLIISYISCSRVTTPLRDYTKIEEKNCQLVTHYGGKKFHYPRGIAIGPNNEVVMIDKGNEEVIIFDKDLKLIRTFGQGSGDYHSKLNKPVGVAVNLNVIAVSEYDHHVVKIFLSQGDYLSKFGSRGSGDGQFICAQGLCYNSNGLLYAVDYGNHRVQVFKDNMFVFKFGSEGHSPGQFQRPRYIAIDSSDQVYVTDQSTDGGISVFSEDGHFIKKINCGNPLTIFIAPDDHIITGVFSDNDVIVFSPTHELTTKFGVCGKGRGQFDGIHGIAINNSGPIFFTESSNKRLQIITP